MSTFSSDLTSISTCLHDISKYLDMNLWIDTTNLTCLTQLIIFHPCNLFSFVYSLLWCDYYTKLTKNPECHQCLLILSLEYLWNLPTFLQPITNALVIFHLDYCNCLWIGLSPIQNLITFNPFSTKQPECPDSNKNLITSVSYLKPLKASHWP